jgi:hypothetical protein
VWRRDGRASARRLERGGKGGRVSRGEGGLEGEAWVCVCR